MKSDSLFVLLDELQQIHGLRTDDFVRYRRYCTRKLERLRSKFKLHHTPSSQVKVSLELCKKDSEALHLILFKCEWFWAEISQLRNELSNNSRKKHHLRSVCLNSLKYIQELKNLSQETFEIGSNLRLEYLSYVNLIEGIVRNELKQFSEAFNCLQKSKIVLEELIQRNFQVSLLESKISELETVMRVCQYSADMYDVVIEVREQELNDFKVNQLTEKLLESKLSETEGQTIIKFKTKSFKLSPEIQIDKSYSKNLKIAREIMKKQHSKDENCFIQLAYFENRFYSKLIGRTLWKLIKKGPEIFDCSILLRKLTKSMTFNFDEEISIEFDRVARLLWKLSNIYGNKDKLDVSRNAAEALEIIKTIPNGSGYLYKSILKVKKDLIPCLSSLLIKNAIYSVKPSAPIAPKPSFYDMAFDCLSYEIPNDIIIKQQQSQATSPSSGFSNLLSGFWGKK